jgi:hypothetical protein
MSPGSIFFSSIVVMSLISIASNVDGLLLGWNLENVQPGYKPGLKIELVIILN